MTHLGFLLLYLLAMLPTYILPYFGSNSVLIQAALMSETNTSLGLMGTVLHLGALVALIFLAWARGQVNGKRALIVFPIVAAAFDMLPVLSAIPLVPTVLHVIALVQGFSTERELEDISGIPRLAQHPLLVYLAIGALTVAFSIVVAVTGTVAQGAKEFSAAMNTDAGKDADGKKGQADDAPNKQLAANAPQGVLTDADSATSSSTAGQTLVAPTTWTYDESIDEMRGTRSVWASMPSSNTISMDFPFNEPQSLLLTVRRSDSGKGKSEIDVMLSIPRGIIQCYRHDCSVTAKFDGEDPVTWEAAGPESNDSNLVFVRKAEQFVSKLNTGKQLIVEIPFHGEGRHQFKFELQPLTLPAKK